MFKRLFRFLSYDIPAGFSKITYTRLAIYSIWLWFLVFFFTTLLLGCSKTPPGYRKPVLMFESEVFIIDKSPGVNTSVVNNTSVNNTKVDYSKIYPFITYTI